MTLNDIVALTKAGFTRDEIMKFHAVQENQKPEVQEEKKAVPKEEPKKEPAASDIEKKMNDFMDRLLKMNFLAENSTIQDVDTKSYDFFASVIDPTYNDKNDTKE